MELSDEHQKWIATLPEHHQAMIALVRTHEEAERIGDLETTLATLAPYPVFDMFAFNVHLEGVTIFPFENGLIKGERSYFDRASVLEQLGITLQYSQ